MQHSTFLLLSCVGCDSACLQQFRIERMRLFCWVCGWFLCALWIERVIRHERISSSSCLLPQVAHGCVWLVSLAGDGEWNSDGRWGGEERIRRLSGRSALLSLGDFGWLVGCGWKICEVWMVFEARQLGSRVASMLETSLLLAICAVWLAGGCS